MGMLHANEVLKSFYCILRRIRFNVFICMIITKMRMVVRSKNDDIGEILNSIDHSARCLNDDGNEGFLCVIGTYESENVIYRYLNKHQCHISCC